MVHFSDQVFQDQLEHAGAMRFSQLRITVADAAAFAAGQSKPTLISDFGLKQGLYVSFCHPLETSGGQVLVPVQRQAINQEYIERGFPTRVDFDDVLLDVWDSALLIGTWNQKNELDWVLGNPVPFDFGGSSHEDERLQLSNFRFYQDRVTGDVVLYCTRYGERGSDGKDWLKADCYEYRVGLDEA